MASDGTRPARSGGAAGDSKNELQHLGAQSQRKQASGAKQSHNAMDVAQPLFRRLAAAKERRKKLQSK